MVKTVLVIGTLDTKEKEIAYLRKRIEAENLGVLVMDVSCKYGRTTTLADISCETVAQEAGKSFAEVSKLDKLSAVKTMSTGACEIARNMLVKGDFYAIIAMGGGNGTEIATHVMRQLPIGFPKIMISPAAIGNVRHYVGTKDIIMINSIGDISLNRITKRIINNAVLALKGIASGRGSIVVEEIKPTIGITVFAATQSCVDKAKDVLEKKGFEVITFHASGGGRALEELVKAGEISGVLDITTSELVDELVGVSRAGPNRLEAAGAMGIPQVISLGSLDVANFGAKEAIPEKYRDRKFHFYLPTTTVMRTNVEENRLLGKIIAEKVNQTRGPTAILVPLQGFSLGDRKGGERRKTTIDGKIIGDWYDPEADFALINSLRQHLDFSKVSFREEDLHINDPKFAEIAVELLVEMMGKASPAIK